MYTEVDDLEDGVFVFCCVHDVLWLQVSVHHLWQRKHASIRVTYTPTVLSGRQ